MKAPDDISGVWRAIGGAFRINFRGGAVGRVGQLTIGGGALIVILGVVIVIRNPTASLWVMGALLLFLILGLAGALAYCLLHPQFAALGDAQMERVMKHDQGARGLNTAALPASVERPTENPLLLEHAGERAEGQ